MRQRWPGDRRPSRVPGLGCVFLLALCWTTGGGAHAPSYRNSSDPFVERCRAECDQRGDVAACWKYRLVGWIHQVVRHREFSYGPVRIVRIAAMPGRTILPRVAESRAFDSRAVEALNFVRDAVEDLLTKRALVYTIDDTASARSFGTVPTVMDEDEFEGMMRSGTESEGDWRIFKKKKSLILPVLILLNLVKLKLLLLPIFLGVHFIKKLLVLGSLIAPSILAHLKVCKVAPPHPPPYHAWATAAEAPVDYPTGYGQEEAWAHRNDYQASLPYMPYHGYRNPYG